MRSHRKLFVLVMMGMLFASACQQADRSIGIENGPEKQIIQQTAVGNTFSNALLEPIDAQKETYLSDRKIIKEGEIAFKTKDAGITELFIKETIIQYEGYIAMENIHKNESSGLMENVIEVRVPANQFDQFLAALSAKAGKFDKKDIQTKDVTEDFIDTDARIRSKKVLEERYFELLSQGKTIDDILKVEAEITAVRNQIDMAQGHLNYLQNKTAYSTLKIIYYEPALTPTAVRTPGFGDQFIAAFQSGWNIILQLLIGLATIWPLLILIGAGVYIVLRMNKKGRNILAVQ